MLTSPVISVPPKTTLTKAIALMAKHKISCLVVIDKGKPVGILTERDLVLALNQRTPLHGLKTEDLMSPKVITANINIDIFEALDILGTNNIRHLVITDSRGTLSGIITQSDIRNNLGFECFVEIKQISKIMTKNVVTTELGTFLPDVISRMAEYAISCIVAVKDGYPVGMFTERDIVKLFKSGTDITPLKIEDVMSSPVETVQLDTPVHEASKVMNQKKIRRMVVVDKNGRSAGLITQSDIIKRFERRYIEILKDIIREKEVALQETKKLLSDKIVLDNIMRSSMDIAIVASDLDCRIIYFNPFAEKIYGLKTEKAIGMTIMDLLRKESAGHTQLEEAIETVKNGKDFRYLSNQTKKGKVRFIESVVSGIRNRNRQLAGYVLMSRDITARKLADEALQNSEKKYRNVVDTALAGIFQTTVSDDVLFANDALLRILEFESLEEAVTKGIIKRFKEPEKISSLIETLYEKGKVDNFETEILTRSQKTINLILSATLEGNVISGVIIDITRIKNLEEQLHQSQKMEALGTLTGGIAHEFNNILMTISTSAQLSQREIALDHPLRDNIDMIVDATWKAAQLTQGLLSYTRMPTTMKAPTDVNSLIETMGGYLANIVRKNVDFTVLTSGRPLAIRADRSQIEQVIMNLATNALDAMEKMGALIIQSEHKQIDNNSMALQESLPAGEYVVISVTDTGTGISRKTQARMFEPFFTTKTIGKGTGLGLSIVYGIVKKHDGHISVESEPGKGTTFKIYLPAIHSECVQACAQLHSLPTVGTGTVLFAEDDKTVLKVTAQVLEKAGYQVIAAVDGEDAVKKYKQFKDEINLLFFDVVMPKMSGMDAYDEIRKINPDVKILFVTGYIADDSTENTIVDAGLPIMTKPVSPGDLEKKIREILC